MRHLSFEATQRTTVALILLLMLANLSLPAQSILMRIPDSAVVSANTIDVPIYADNTLTGSNVYAYILQVSFNQNYLQFLSTATTGTLSAPFGTPALNTGVAGKVTLAAAGTAPLEGAGKFIYLKFKALQPGSIVVSFTGAQYNYFNEGIPPMAFDNGAINITVPPSITVSPNTATIAKGETIQFSVTGGIAPYQWSVTHPEVASISATGLLTGTNSGITRVIAQDNQGLIDTSNGQVVIRAMRLSIPVNLSSMQGTEINVPVNTTSLSGLDIYSGNISLSYNQNLLTPVGVALEGSLMASWPAPIMNTLVPGLLSVGFAGSTPLDGSGPLLFLRFHVSPVNSGSSPISFTSGIFNEDLTPAFTNGQFTVINLPVLSIAPSVGVLVAGQTRQFALTGGATPPVQWSVSNPQIATITSEGLMTTLRGGNVTVTAIDAIGASATSGNWLIYDNQVIMPDTTTCPAAGEFFYPIWITGLPAGEEVGSVQATVTYNTTFLTFQEVSPSGTLTEGWSFASNTLNNQIIFAGSGSNMFSEAGILVKLKFLLKPAFAIGSIGSLQLTSILLNEGVPNPLVDASGKITGVNPDLVVSVSINASSNPSVNGSPVSFTAIPVNGGDLPVYQWKVNGIPVANSNYSTYTYIPANDDVIHCELISNAACVINTAAVSDSITISTYLPSFVEVTGQIPAGNYVCYNATDTIRVAGNGSFFSVMNGGSVTMIAGLRIFLLPGTNVFYGGYLKGIIAPDGPFCATPPPEDLIYPVPANQKGNNSDHSFLVFPNPNSGMLTIVPSDTAFNSSIQVDIYDLSCKRVISQHIMDHRKPHVSLEGFNSGFYLLKIRSNGHCEIHKVIKL